MIEVIHELNNATWPAAVVLSAAALGVSWVLCEFIRKML